MSLYRRDRNRSNPNTSSADNRWAANRWLNKQRARCKITQWDTDEQSPPGKTVSHWLRRSWATIPFTPSALQERGRDKHTLTTPTTQAASKETLAECSDD